MTQSDLDAIRERNENGTLLPDDVRSLLDEVDMLTRGVKHYQMDELRGNPKVKPEIGCRIKDCELLREQLQRQLSGTYSEADDDLILVHADGGDCHGSPIVDGHCEDCGIAPDMQSTQLWRRGDVYCD